MRLLPSATVSLVLILPVPTTTQFGTIKIDWAAEAAGGMAPHLVGLDEEESPVPSEEDAFEVAWWRGGFADDTQSEWCSSSCRAAVRISLTRGGAAPSRFAESANIRQTRPSSVAFSVGTAYKHATSGALGVIVGWDARTRAPREWIDRNAGQLGATLERLHAPHYSVLEELDGRVMKRYIVGDWIQVIMPEKAPSRHPDIHQYFSDFKDGRYMPRAWLRQRYPEG